MNLRKIKNAYRVLKQGIKFLWIQHHFLISPRLLKEYIIKFKGRVNSLNKEEHYDPFNQDDYLAWIKEKEHSSYHQEFTYQPLISIILPVYNVAGKYLKECLESILNQTYSNLEICIVDDCSTKQETIDILNEYVKKEKRIKFMRRSKNGNISTASNDALSLATGEYIALIDNDDTIELNALYEVVRCLNEDNTIDLIYTDEDKLDLKGNRCNPHFKPDWSPDTFLSNNYICHLPILRRSLVEKIGGFTVGLEGVQDYDLFLRFTEITNRIRHIPKVLYHWRMIPGSTSMTIDNKPYIIERTKEALNNALQRRGIQGYSNNYSNGNYCYIVYGYDKEPMISIILSTYNGVHSLKPCLKSIYEKTNYKNFEVIIANREGKETSTIKLLEMYRNRYSNFHIIDVNNAVIKEVQGNYLVLLDSASQILSSNWLETMVGYAMQEHIGAVGTKIVNSSKNIQYSGIIMSNNSATVIEESFNSKGIYGRLIVPYNYLALSPAALMVETRKFRLVGGLEGTLQGKYNSIDLCLRLYNQGLNNVLLPQVMVMQHESKHLLPSDLSLQLKEDPCYNPNYSKTMLFYLDKKAN